MRVKQGHYIQGEGEEFKRLSECGLVAGTSFYLTGVKISSKDGAVLMSRVMGNENIEIVAKMKAGIYSPRSAN
ncbi:hypothetical protein QUB19_21985 [Microcoleus sp. B4-C5]|uniref:hypothetical protein n=1 Tax=unclassified Microcoleus TaxID=2642155 RepID=UPI002FD46EE1